MRIISQNGKVDLPHECFGVEIDAINDTKIIAYAVNSDDDTIWKLAEYSTKEKSRKGYGRVEDGIRELQNSGRQYVLFRLRLSQSLSISA